MGTSTTVAAAAYRAFAVRCSTLRCVTVMRSGCRRQIAGQFGGVECAKRPEADAESRQSMALEAPELL